MCGCQYLGPGYDPRTWNYSEAPTPYCGKPTIEGKSYCGEHYWTIYQKGSAVAGRRKEKEIDREIAELKRQQELEAYDD